MANTIHEVRTDNLTIRRAVVACGIGQIFEIYDFVIYGLMAGALAHTFFSVGNPIVALLNTFATFAVGFVMRPVEVVVIGAYGDRHGRRAALVVTIGAMAGATGLIGHIPSYNSIGLLAPVLLVLCRMLQGFSTGGEWGRSAAFLVGYSPPGRRGIIGSYQQAATALGLLAATLVSFLLTSMMDAATFSAWGWRCAFLLGFVLGPIGYYFRTKVEETPAYELTVVTHTVNCSPLRRSFAEYPGALAAAFGISIIGCVINKQLYPTGLTRSGRILFLLRAAMPPCYIVVLPENKRPAERCHAVPRRRISARSDGKRRSPTFAGNLHGPQREDDDQQRHRGTIKCSSS